MYWILIVSLPARTNDHTRLRSWDQIKFDNLSSTPTMERDMANHAFHGWVDSCAKIVATSDTVPVSLMSFLLFPYIHGLRMWKHLF